MKTTKKSSRLAGPLALFGLLTMGVPAAAQEHRQSPAESAEKSAGITLGMMTGMTEMCPGMMGRTADSGMGEMAMPVLGGTRASMILRQREALELSAAKIAELETIRERHAAAHEEYLGDIQPLRESLSSRLEASRPDLARYESLLREIADRQIAMQMRMAELGVESMAVLTEDQRAKLRYGRRLMQGMMREMMRKETAGEEHHTTSREEGH